MTERTRRPALSRSAPCSTGGSRPAPALIVPEDGQVLTYAQAAARVETLAAAAGRAGRPARRPGRAVAAQRPRRRAAAARDHRARRRRGPAESRPTPRPSSTFFLTDIAPRLLLIPASGAPRRAAAAAAATGTTADRACRRPTTARRSCSARRPGRPSRPAAAVLRAGRAGRRGRRPAHQRHDQPAQAGPAAAAQPDGLGPHDRRALPAQPRGCLVLRDAAVPHPRPGGVDLRGAERGRRGHRPAPVHRRTGSGRRPASTAPPGCRPARRCTR